MRNCSTSWRTSVVWWTWRQTSRTPRGSGFFHRVWGGVGWGNRRSRAPSPLIPAFLSMTEEERDMGREKKRVYYASTKLQKMIPSGPPAHRGLHQLGIRDVNSSSPMPKAKVKAQPSDSQTVSSGGSVVRRCGAVAKPGDPACDRVGDGKDHRHAPLALQIPTRRVDVSTNWMTITSTLHMLCDSSNRALNESGPGFQRRKGICLMARNREWLNVFIPQ